MDVKQFFRKRLVAFVAALLSVGLCGLPQSRADQNYQPDVGVGGTITGTKDISAYGVGYDNGYIATFRNSAADGNLKATIQDWKVTNNATPSTYGEASYTGTFYYDQTDDGIIWKNAKLVLAAPTTSTTSSPRNVNVTVTGKNQFGNGLNVGDWGNTMGHEYDGLPIRAREVDVLFGSMNDGNVDDEFNGNTGAYADVTFATGSNSHFWGGVQFGGQDGAHLVGESGNAKVTFEEGSTVIFENQNTYFGGGGWNANGVTDGGTADVTFKGTTTFNQRAVFGGGASSETGEPHVKVGDSNVVFENGTTYFTGKNATYSEDYNNGKIYNQKNYYGVYFSSIGGLDGLAEGGTANVSIKNGTHTFDTEVHSVGNYDFTPYGDIIRSKDDFDVTWGGSSNINVTGGITQFNGRSTFGAPNGESNFNISGGKVTFGGTVRSANMGKGDILDDVPFSEINTNYNGQDIPYVYFGGKTITDPDGEVNFWNNYYNSPGHDAYDISASDWEAGPDQVANVNLSGRSKTILNTTGFVGGANYKLLDGSDDIENTYTSSLYKDFTYGPEGATTTIDKKFTVDYTRFNTNADTADTAIGDYETGKVDETSDYTHQLLKDDAGSGTFNVVDGAELRLGLYNTTQLYNAPDTYLNNEHEIVTPENAGFTTNRTAQVQLIGNSSEFNADWSNLYFTIDPNGTKCQNESGEWVERLNVGRLAFQEINITGNTKLYLTPAFAKTLCNELIGKDGKDKEFYSIEAFHDTDGTDLNIDDAGGKHLFYEVGVERLANDDGTPNPDVPLDDHARLHVTYHDPHSVVADGNLGINMDRYLRELCLDQPDDYKEALEDIWNSDDKVEAQEKFDDLAGGIYGDWLNAQVQRQISFSNMLANRLATDDMGLCQFCCQNQCAQYASDCEPGCNQCCARRQCEFGGRIIGKYPRYCEPRRSIWGSYLGNYGNGFYWKGFTQYHEESSGMAVGIEWKNVCCRVFGLYFGYSTSDIWHTNAAHGNSYSRIKSDDFNFGLYAKWDACAMGGYWTANGTFSYNNLDAERFYNTQSFNNNFTADPNGLSASAYVERGWMYVEDHGFVINPYISVQYSFATIDDFTEDGTSNSYGVDMPSNMNLYCYDMAYHSLRGQFGVRVSRDFIVGCNNWQILRLTLGAAYAHEFLDPQAIYYTHVMGSWSMSGDPQGYVEPPLGDYEMRSNGCSRGWANLMFSADYRLTQRLSANFQYNAYFNQYKTVNNLNATLRIDF